MVFIFNVDIVEESIIQELPKNIRELVDLKGEIIYDKNKPDGVFRKLMDNSRINSLNYKLKISLNEGLIKTYNNHLEFNADF